MSSTKLVASIILLIIGPITVLTLYNLEMIPSDSSELVNPLLIGTLLLGGFISGLLFGETVYSAIKYVAIGSEVLVGLLILIFFFILGGAMEDAENAQGLEGIGAMIIFILIIVFIVILIGFGVVIVVLALFTAVAGWIGNKFHLKIFGEPPPPTLSGPPRKYG